MAKKSQVQKFRETARALECNESEAAFDRALKKVAKASPPKEIKATTQEGRAVLAIGFLLQAVGA
jgi:hypothetical protein